MLSGRGGPGCLSSLLGGLPLWAVFSGPPETDSAPRSHSLPLAQLLAPPSTLCHSYCFSGCKNYLLTEFHTRTHQHSILGAKTGLQASFHSAPGRPGSTRAQTCPVKPESHCKSTAPAQALVLPASPATILGRWVLTFGDTACVPVGALVFTMSV